MPLPPRPAADPVPPVVSRRVAGTPTTPAVAPRTLPLAGGRSLPVSTAAPAESAIAAAARGSAPALTLVPTAADTVQRLADPAVAPAMTWPAQARMEAATAALAPVARVARPIAQTMPAIQAAPSQPLAQPELTYLPLAAPRRPDEPVVQRAPEVPQFLSIEVPVQRAEEAAPAAGTGGGATGAGGAGGVPQHSDKELDDLARQLYERLRSRLRMELLVDRERAGLITDLRG
jgi:hypothetical protein